MSEDLIRQVDEMFRSLMAEIGCGTSHKLRMERAMIKLKHQYHRNLLMLEAVISAMLDTHDHKDVSQILRDHADQLVEYL